jgi:hypothetical protein
MPSTKKARKPKAARTAAKPEAGKEPSYVQNFGVGPKGFAIGKEKPRTPKK